MNIHEQLAQSQQPIPFPPADYLSLRVNADRGLLANESVQVVSFSSDTLRDVYESTFGRAPAPARLAVLKWQKFTIEGRRARIDASLAALNAPQPIQLSVEAWKEILEEIEDED